MMTLHKRPGSLICGSGFPSSLFIREPCYERPPPQPQPRAAPPPYSPLVYSVWDVWYYGWQTQDHRFLQTVPRNTSHTEGVCSEEEFGGVCTIQSPYILTHPRRPFSFSIDMWTDLSEADLGCVWLWKRLYTLHIRVSISFLLEPYLL